MIEEKAKIRIIRVLLDVSAKEFAEILGVTPCSVSGWENGRCTPQRGVRRKISEMCDKNGICFLPSGMPVPKEDLLPDQQIYDPNPLNEEINA